MLEPKKTIENRVYKAIILNASRKRIIISRQKSVSFTRMISTRVREIINMAVIKQREGCACRLSDRGVGNFESVEAFPSEAPCFLARLNNFPDASREKLIFQIFLIISPIPAGLSPKRTGSQSLRYNDLGQPPTPKRSKSRIRIDGKGLRDYGEQSDVPGFPRGLYLDASSMLDSLARYRKFHFPKYSAGDPHSLHGLVKKK